MKKILWLVIALILDCKIAIAGDPFNHYWWHTATVNDVKREISKHPKYTYEIFFNIALQESPYPEVIKLLLKDGVNMKDYEGQTVLMLAAINKNPEIVKIFIEKGLDVNAKNRGGKTALMQAAECGNLEVVKLLIETKADVNAKDRDGETALMLAAERGNLEVVKLLIETKTDVNARDKKGETAWYKAAKKDYPKIKEIKKILKDAGAETSHIKLSVNKIKEGTSQVVGAVVFIPLVLTSAAFYSITRGKSFETGLACVTTVGIVCDW